ncbi:penicillin-binding transpeptidase domain-containing protein [Paenibacillus sp. UNC451MF]|uniref:penicillin-binding transpeptidase domain-containing protein n=1 Tax=Paenibacillus sp. UNC451MF TaxID=1449063 RepID=UPI00048FC3A2|nr:penicillin-binding transpeptidase domain-containing protein [Paenibacillus sp. UNC451MF]
MKKNRIAAWGRLFALTCVLIALAGCKGNEPNPDEAMQSFTNAWQQQQYEAMYEWLSTESKQKIDAITFVTRHKSIYEGIGTSDFSIQWQPVEQDDSRKVKDKKTYKLHVNLNSTYGPISYDQNALVVKEDVNWRVQWDSTYIHPKLGDKDKVRVEDTKAERGEILDRQGFGLAINEDKLELGIIPKKLPESTDESVQKLADLLKLDPKTIQNLLKATWVKPDFFVPVTIVPKGDQRLEALTTIPGVTYRTKKVRSYPLEDAAAHLVGYIGKLSAEELSKYKDKGYTADDWIGKTGLELSLESTLRGKDGGRIYIVDADGKEKATLASREAVNGEDVKLTIDSALQSDLYRQLAKDSGSGAALHPMTGEVLALVSAPSYNPNLFISGVTAEQWKSWTDDPNKPLLNRFARAYAPGSAFKPITAAIALQEHALDPNATKEIVGKTWKKDSSWGNYYVSRVSVSQSAVDLSKAMMYSDNIYFAQVALEMGEQKFMQDASKFGFGEKLPLPLAFDASSLSNTPKMKNDIQLADSGYGQGEVVMNSLHVATTYTVFTNNGTMLKPSLILSEGAKPEPWKSGLLDPDVVKTVTDKMVEVIENPAGTGHAAMIKGTRLAGKTGTAELKQKKDVAGQENGWFVAFNTDNPQLLVALMVEQVQERGGSHYLSEKIKTLFKSYIKTS